MQRAGKNFSSSCWIILRGNSLIRFCKSPQEMRWNLYQFHKCWKRKTHSIFNKHHPITRFLKPGRDTIEMDAQYAALVIVLIPPDTMWQVPWMRMENWVLGWLCIFPSLSYLTKQKTGKPTGVSEVTLTSALSLRELGSLRVAKSVQSYTLSGGLIDLMILIFPTN